jgi:hypothetical protein
MNRRVAFWTLTVLVTAALAGAPAVRAATYYVRAPGDDRKEGTTAQAAFRTVTRAAQVLAHGDRIVIGPGQYREAVLISERFGTPEAPLAVVGDESGKLTGDTPGAVVVEPAIFGEPALYIHRSQHVQVSGLTFRGRGVGLQVEKVRGLAIERCTFDGLSKGLAVALSDDLRLESAVIARCITGAQVKQTTRSRLAHLTVASCSAVGVLVSTSAGGEIRNSIFADNGTAMVVDPASASSWSSDHNAIAGTVGSWGLAGQCRIIYEWFSSSGQERHSTYTLPAFAGPAAYDLHPAPQVTWGGGLPGQATGLPLTPPVARDRDGKPFAVRGGRVCVGAYDYPEPQPGPGWKKVKAALAEGPRASAGIYTPDGTLVRTLLADEATVRELWWDGLDDNGAVAPAGKYEVRGVTHDVRMLDDGNLGDNGSPLGTYNCDNAERVVVFRDGSFAITTLYDEAGIPLRFHTRTGVSICGSSLAEADIWAIADAGDTARRTLLAGVGRQLQTIVFPGERAPMPNGAKFYSIFADNEKLLDKDGKTKLRPTGLAVGGGRAYVALPVLNVVRVMDLATGAKVADWPAGGNVGDVKVAPDGTVWTLAGAEIVAFGPGGQVAKRYPTGLPTPRYLAVAGGKLAVCDPGAAKISLLNPADGQVAATLGRPRPPKTWMPVAGDLFGNLRDLAFRDDGTLLVCEHGRVRAIDPETKRELFAAVSTFMDVAVPHPLDPSYVYCYGASIYRCDHATGAWQPVVEGPAPDGDGALAHMSSATLLGGRPYLMAGGQRRLPPDDKGNARRQSGYFLLDVAKPLEPRVTGFAPVGAAYRDVRFAKNGDIVLGIGGPEELKFAVYPFGGFEADGKPIYDFTKPVTRDCGKDTSSTGLCTQFGLAVDPQTNDYYIMALSAQHKKTVPAWGASGSGLAKLDAGGKLKWFSLTSGGNFTGTAMLRDKNEAWAFIAKDFGGQVDVFNSDGLRLATLNWGWLGNWTCGFVDMRDGLTAYRRPDGKPGVYVEDDSIGRLMRGRLDGAETRRKVAAGFTWAGGAAAGPAPLPNVTGGPGLQNPLSLPRVAPLPVDGDWNAWAAAGVTPQCVMLPLVGWGYTWPRDLLETFRAGTGGAAFAHDGKNLYCYFLVTDDTPIFGDNPAIMFSFDGVEFWVEEEQFGLGLLAGGKPALFKYRYHNRAGAEWSAGYKLDDANVWGKMIPDAGAHPLGRYLGNVLGTSLDGKSAYVLMGRIPLEEIKLVGGIAGRKGGEVRPTTAGPGELIRLGVAISGMSAWGRAQDYKVYWPLGLMFSDPTSLTPFAFGQ